MWPIDLDLGFKVIYAYEGFYFVLSIGAAALLIVHRMKKAGMDPGPFLDSLIWILLGAILGARLSDFLFWDTRAFLADPLSIVRIWEGGLSITGGLAGGVIAGYVAFRRKGVDFWHLFAVASPAVLVGQALGRVGCFLNGDAWGTPTRLPWGVALPKFGTLVPDMVRDTRVPTDAWLWSVRAGFTSPFAGVTTPLHPVQLYEALGDLLLAAVILQLSRRLQATRGPWPLIFWVHLGGYSLLRFGLEFLHGDRSALLWGPMTALQIGLLLFAGLAAVKMVRT
jgi:phosphatidylglycerol:prolipoprotein diacylglycerol transferase